MKRPLAAMISLTAAVFLAASSARAGGGSSSGDPFLANAYDAYSSAGSGAASSRIYSYADAPESSKGSVKIAGAFGAHIKDAGGDDTAPPLDDGDDEGSDFPPVPSAASPLPAENAGFAEGTRLDPVQTSPQLSPDSDRLVGVVEPKSALGQLSLISIKLPEAQRRLRDEGAANSMNQLWDAEAATPWMDLERHAREHNYLRHSPAEYADSLNER